ncbi:MAG: DUF58 domain-containing protein [Ruaniaceae bacterium]|nr:DUF58 domain-containing protein [Ruaniaceae bacterium]
MMLPLTLTRRGWGTLLGSLALWGVWWVIGLRDLWYLIALLGSMVAVSLVMALLVPLLSRPTVRVGVSNPTPTVGERITVTADVRRRLQSISGFQLHWELPDHAIADSIGPGSPAVLERSWAAGARGQQTLRVTAASFMDPLGLARRTRTVRAAAELLVLPQLIPTLATLLDGGTVGQRGEDDSRVRSTIRGSGVPGGVVRSYRSGDAWRQIHWKQSARQGELLVNVNESSEKPERALLLETAGSAYSSRAALERAVSAAATLAVRLLQDGSSIRLYLDGDSITLGTVAETLRHLTLVQTTENAPLWEARSIPPLSLVVTGRVSESLARYLNGVPGGGTVVLTSETMGSEPPPQWRWVQIDGS